MNHKSVVRGADYAEFMIARSAPLRRLTVLAGLTSLMAFSLACGATKDPGGDPGSLDDTGGSGDDSSAPFDIGGPPPGEDAVGFDIKGADIGPPPDSSCAAASSAATLIPLDIFIMQDQSGSMREKTSTGISKWEAVKAAIKTFMDDPASAGLGVGIQYFGIPTTDPFGGRASSCNVADYTKAEVEIAPLPGVEAAIVASYAAHSPSTDTPTGVALSGAVQHGRAWATKHPDHVVIVLLATDGMPTACDPQDIPGISAIASSALAAKPSIHTYVIGVLSDSDLSAGADTNLNDISKAGNGGDAIIIKASSADVSTAFLAALKKIRGSALACAYTVPTGVGADYNKVNVAFTTGGKSSVIPYVGSAAKCDPVTGGWYYDIPPASGTPTKILMCDATCKALSADPAGKLDIQVGCATIGPK